MSEPTPEQPDQRDSSAVDEATPEAPESPSSHQSNQAGEPPLMSARKIALQAVGFVLGIGLLVWCVWIAVRQGSGEGDGPSAWELIGQANPWWVVGLAGCTLVNLTVNGAIFWLVVQPVKPLRLRHLVLLNFVTSVLNYAPIRAGLIARVAYHLRVDRLSLVQVGAWLAAVSYTMVLGLASAAAATLIRPTLDVVWALIVLGFFAAGCLMMQAMASHSLVERYGRGMEKMLSNPLSLWGAAGLRIFDLGSLVGRMAFAAAILRLEASAADIVFLGLTALVVSLNPVGRVGFREMAVAFVATRLLSPAAEMDAAAVSGQMAALSLLESAGEAMVAIPVGGVLLLWYRKRWMEAKANGAATE